MGIYEIMTINEPIRELIMKRSSTGAIREAAIKNGMSTLRDSGLQAIFDGISSLDEVVKETVSEE